VLDEYTHSTLVSDIELNNLCRFHCVFSIVNDLLQMPATKAYNLVTQIPA